MGFNSFASALATLAGIELHRMLRKRQNTEDNNPIKAILYSHTKPAVIGQSPHLSKNDK